MPGLTSYSSTMVWDMSNPSRERQVTLIDWSSKSRQPERVLLDVRGISETRSDYPVEGALWVPLLEVQWGARDAVVHEYWEASHCVRNLVCSHVRVVLRNRLAIPVIAAQSASLMTWLALGGVVPPAMYGWKIDAFLASGHAKSPYAFRRWDIPFLPASTDGTHENVVPPNATHLSASGEASGLFIGGPTSYVVIHHGSLAADPRSALVVEQPELSELVQGAPLRINGSATDLTYHTDLGLGSDWLSFNFEIRD